MRKNWCESCRRQVLPIKIFKRRLFFILLLLTFVGGIIYLIYYLISTGDTCPICKQTKYLRYKKPKEAIQRYPPEKILPQAELQSGTVLKFCPYCGSDLPPPGDYCHHCGNKI